MFLNIVVVVGLLYLVSFLFFHYLMSTIIQHSLLGDPLNSLIVLVGLLFLRNSLSILILPCTIFKVGLLLNFTIWAHLGRTHKSLADIGAFLSRAMKIAMGVGKLHHF